MEQNLMRPQARNLCLPFSFSTSLKHVVATGQRKVMENFFLGLGNSTLNQRSQRKVKSCPGSLQEDIFWHFFWQLINSWEVYRLPCNADSIWFVNELLDLDLKCFLKASLRTPIGHLMTSHVTKLFRSF